MKSMKYLSMMAGLVALSASPLLAQEAGVVSPALPAAAVLSAPLVATTPAQAKPSPEFRSYLRLLVANVLSEASMAITTLKITSSEDFEKNADALAMMGAKAFNSTSRAALTGEEKAFVDEIATLVPQLYVAYKATDTSDQDAMNKLQMQAMIPMMMLSQKYPKVLSYFKGETGANNFFDVEKVEAFAKSIEPEMSKLNNESEGIPTAAKVAGQVAEMIRKNEI